MAFYFLIVMISLLVVSIVFVLRRMVWESRNYLVTHYSITSPKLNDLTKDIKVVFLGDLHNQVYGNRNDILIHSIKEQEPDVILITGDMIFAKKNINYVQMDESISFLKQLPSIAPVYYVYGNHEQRLKEKPEKYGSITPFYDTLSKAGITFLANASKTITLQNIPIRIIGLELPLYTNGIVNKEKVTSASVTQYIGSSNPEYYEILLVHSPQYANAFLSWGADLILAGHYHGGIIRIPGFRGVITPNLRIFPRHSGEKKQHGNQVLVVTKGLGSHSIKLRLNNRPEIVVLHLTREELVGETERLRKLNKLKEVDLQPVLEVDIKANNT